MHVSIVGSGYVGTTIAACLADLGHDVVNVEIDEGIVETINAGESPIHEPGLDELIAEHADSRLRATTDYAAVCDTDLTFLCLPTPQHDDGSLDLSIMEAAARSLGVALAERPDRHSDDNPDHHLVVVKSTVLPGSTEEVIGPAIVEALEAGTDVDDAPEPTVDDRIELAMNPEFLRMSTAVTDFLEPDKVVIGTESEPAADTLRTLYEPIVSREETHLVETAIREAELIKYANNAFLAAKVSLVNELGNVAKEYDADAYDVLDAVGLDDRIESRFMRSGLGWGGSCFPKDVNALRAGARERGYEPALLDAVVGVNDLQPRRLIDTLERHVPLEGGRIAVLGLAFKPGTDDVRKSRALDVIAHLADRGATVVAYDPVAMDRVRALDDRPAIEFAESATDALAGADGAVVATDWPEFDDLTFEGMNRRVLVDGRRIDVDRDALEVYEGLTW